MRKLKRVIGYYIVLPLIIPILILSGLLVLLTFLFSYLIIALIYMINILRRKNKKEIWYKFFINEIKYDALDFKS